MAVDLQTKGASTFSTARNSSAPVETEEKSLGELFADLARESSTLIRQEVNLAKAEIGQKAAKVGKDATLIAIGGFIAYAGALVLFAAITLMLVQLAGMPAWGAALLVSLAALAGGGFLALQGVNALKKIDPTPHQTLDTLQEDAKWAKQQL